MAIPDLQVEEYQYGDDGVVLNGDFEEGVTNIIDLKSIQGLDNAPVRTQQRDREGTDGGYVDSEHESIRTVTLEGTIYADVFNMEEYLDSLKANFAPTRVNKPLYYMTDAGLRMVLGKSQGIRYNKDQLRRVGSADCQIQFLCEDPRVYDPTPLSASTTLGTGTTTGRGYPKAYTFGYGGVATENGLQIVLAGNRDTPAVLRVDGPIINPVVVYDNTGTTFTHTITLAEGSYIEIDLANKSVRLDGVANRRYIMKLTGKWPLLEPGVNSFRLLGTQSPPEPLAKLTVTAYSARR